MAHTDYLLPIIFWSLISALVIGPCVMAFVGGWKKAGREIEKSRPKG